VQIFVVAEGLSEVLFGGVEVAEYPVADALPVRDGAPVVHRAEH
jgi:hypothetical protein